MARWRLAAGIAVLLALAGFCGLLFRPYLQNWRLQQYIEQIAFDEGKKGQDPAVYTAAVADQASRLGLPVPVDHIRVTKSEGGVFIEARYFVRVDLLVYTVDLHFRPAAGVR